jgi:predicted nucleic acid-binding Zn ribbon protein
MTTYVYETIPQIAGEEAVRFEYQQGMNDPKLTEQPGTGKPVRRLISGGFALLRVTVGSAGSVTDDSFHQRD